MALPLAISGLQGAKKDSSSLVALRYDKWCHGVLQLDAICPPCLQNWSATFHQRCCKLTVLTLMPADVFMDKEAEPFYLSSGVSTLLSKDLRGEPHVELPPLPLFGPLHILLPTAETGSWLVLGQA